MMAKLRIQIALLSLLIASSSTCDFVPMLDPLGMATQFGDIVYSVDWCGCNYLAVGGYTDNPIYDEQEGLVGIYQFNQATQTLCSQIMALFGYVTYSVKWCPSCQFLAAGGSDDSGDGIVQIYSFNSTNTPILQPLPSGLQYFGNQVDSIDWCPSCSYLAASGIGFAGGAIQVYYFDGENLTVTCPEFDTTNTNEIYQIRWCDDCHYLAAVGGRYLEIFGFDPSNAGNGLTELYSLPFPPGAPTYQAIDWCGDCGYIAAAGFGSGFPGSGIIDIYKFDAAMTPSLTFVYEVTIQGANGASFLSVKWCQGCDNLAAVGYTDTEFRNNIVQLYHFEASTGILSFVQTYTLDTTPAANTRFILPEDLVDWCGQCCYLAAAGAASFSDQLVGLVQLFKGNPCLTAPTNLHAQKLYHRFPTQVDIINQICWDPVAGAVAYNVYADAALSILLATIPATSICYSQHQIRSGTSLTYYVTAVDTNGNNSAPAMVTI